MDPRNLQIRELGLLNWISLRWNLTTPQLVEQAIRRGEGHLAANGTLLVTTGSRTGRSPKDRFIEEEPSSKELVAWGNVNQPISERYFSQLLSKIQSYLQHKDLFVQDLYVGQHPKYRVPLRIVSEFAWGALFAHTLFVRPQSAEELENHQPEYTILHAPRLLAEPKLDGTNSETFVVLSLGRKIVLIGGSEYGGEIKKSMFSIMNYLLPLQGVFPMHCSANVGEAGDTALFFGLSGTGKTSLSADPERKLIGDDEHGWGDDGIFNFEGGCYAKTIRLSPVKEPQIFNAIRFGSIAENVDFDGATRLIDFDSDKITENTRATYPLDYIDNALIPGIGGHPKNIIFLTADAFGVLPPIAKLTPEMAMYHFLTGYTSKLAGTEMGVTEPQTAFSECFGAPFLPLPATRYAEMLGEKMKKHRSDVWLVNTGWSGGPYGVGQRMDIRLTRAMIKAALTGQLQKVEFTPHEVFKVLVPANCPGVPGEVLQPRNTWKDKAAYDQKASELAKRFRKNFDKFPNASEAIKAANPRAD
ncbi:MAG: phosphoenolpyruvate carboxykinase (ATP) [Calditrichaceae bacterium]|nr:phosphoenolpyruvate carboxykinase (ATP) [Calditrichia bacterium]NUQ42204.1 phosphoenolpyruvate carboxykinase (ATP) [Calditrichaceae bacterium]